MTTLMTIGLVVLPFVGVGVVLAWAEWRPVRGHARVVEHRLTNALLATRDKESASSPC
jgi:hypothetical protein